TSFRRAVDRPGLKEADPASRTLFASVPHLARSSGASTSLASAGVLAGRISRTMVLPLARSGVAGETHRRGARTHEIAHGASPSPKRRGSSRPWEADPGAIVRWRRHKHRRRGHPPTAIWVGAV